MTQSVYVTINKLCNKKGIDPEVKEFLISLNDEIPRMTKAESESTKKELLDCRLAIKESHAKIDAYQWVIKTLIDKNIGSY